MSRVLSITVFAVATLPLLAPKVAALAVHLNSAITSIVICTGADMVVIHLGADGKPMDLAQTDHGACVVADPDANAAPIYLSWVKAPRCYQATPVDLSHGLRSQAEIGLLPDLRGPPRVI